MKNPATSEAERAGVRRSGALSLQVKFSALLVALLTLACVLLATIATHHERRALEDEIGKRARELVSNLAGASKDPLLEIAQNEFEGELALERLIEETRRSDGVREVRIIGRDGLVVASLHPAERGNPRPQSASRAHLGTTTMVRRHSRLIVSSPISISDEFLGTAEVELDLQTLINPVVQQTTDRLIVAATAVVCLGVVAGMIFVAILVRPLRRLREGVERLSMGDLEARVPPTSKDEIGELTRAFNTMGGSLLQKQQIQTAFGRYVGDDVLSQLLEGSDKVESGGLEQEITILFCDIRHFTRLSEGMQANEVVALLNEVFALISECILQRGGTIDKFIGDSVMAYFGAPIRHTDHALRAVRSAHAILDAIHERNCRLKEGPAPVNPIVEIGIGIHTGSVVVGNIGSERRTDFTAVGDAVNVAHRLEKLARPREILVSEAVQRRVKQHVHLSFSGERHLLGREEPVQVYTAEHNVTTAEST
ncbi:HAMP domain-containing protein [Myxococcota bacterium]|nr:HAMP domain-containing protein [Myxococcota bacterium]